jgi:iron complex outermembrane recepter protein
VFFILMISAANAQEREGKKDTLSYEIKEAVITGTRTVERIIDIPYSVFRVDKGELSYGKKVSANDVLTDVPGLFLQSRYGNPDLRISIRGFGTRSNSGVRGVRILQDGIPESEPDGETVVDAIDFSSLGGVEVVKGNLSSLYANAPGGVINFASDLDFQKNSSTYSNQTGTFGLQQNGLKLGIANDAHRLLVTYNYHNLDGFRQHSNENQHLLNTVYEGYLGDKSTISVLGNYVDGLTKLPGSLTKEEYDRDPFQAAPLAVAQDYKRITRKGRVAVRFETNFDDTKRNELELTGYGGIKELEKTDDTHYTIATRYSLGALVRFSTKSRLLDRNNVLTVGMDFAAQSGPVTSFDNIGGNRGISVDPEYDEGLTNLGFYFMDHYNLLPEFLDLFCSGRFDRNAFTRNVFIPYGSIDTERVFQNFTPKVGIDCKLTPSVALYTSYGLSYDYPALSELANTPFSTNLRYAINPDLVAERSNNFEFGCKGNLLNPESEWMRKLFFEATFFHYVVRDEIVPFVIGQETYFRNAGKTNRDGLEIGIKTEPFEGFELITNYTFTHFRYDEYNTKIYRPSGDTMENFSGNVVPSVPAHIFNIILNYEFAVSDRMSGLLQWDCDYVGEMFVNDANTERAPGYFFGSAMAGVNLSFKPIGVIAYVGADNLFDRRYVGFININDFYGRYYETGEPRNVYGGMKISYTM